MHQLGSTDPSCFSLQIRWSLQAVKVVWDYWGAAPWGSRCPGEGGLGGSSKLLGNDSQRLEFSLLQVQPDQFAKHCVWLVTILAVDVSPSCGTAAILGPPARKGLAQLENPPLLHALLLSNTGSTSQGLAWEPWQGSPQLSCPHRDCRPNKHERVFFSLISFK